MPKLSQFAAKAAMLYLVTGAIWALGYWLNTIWQVLPGWTPLLQALSPTYVHLITVGWLTQFVFGVMYWMFPVISKTRPRGDVRLAWAAFICLNAGLLTRAVCEPWRALQPLAFNGAALVVSAILQLVIGVAFWILPRRRVHGRGPVEPVWAAFVLLNLGLVTASGFSWLAYWFPEWIWLHRAFPLGLALQVLGLIVFAAYAWRRVLPMMGDGRSQMSDIRQQTADV